MMMWQYHWHPLVEAETEQNDGDSVEQRAFEWVLLETGLENLQGTTNYVDFAAAVVTSAKAGVEADVQRGSEKQKASEISSLAVITAEMRTVAFVFAAVVAAEASAKECLAAQFADEIAHLGVRMLSEQSLC